MIWIVTLISSALTVSTVRAEECADEFRFPETTKVLLEGEQQVCLKLDPLKKVLFRLNCGEKALSTNKTISLKMRKQAAQIMELEAVVGLQGEKISLLEEDKERLYKNWVEENKKRHKAESKVSKSWVGWAAAGVFAVSTVTLGVAFVLK